MKLSIKWHIRGFGIWWVVESGIGNDAEGNLVELDGDDVFQVTRKEKRERERVDYLYITLLRRQSVCPRSIFGTSLYILLYATLSKRRLPVSPTPFLPRLERLVPLRLGYHDPHAKI